MKNKPTLARHFRLYPDKKMTDAEIISAIGSEKLVSVKQEGMSWTLDFQDDQDWDTLIDKLVNYGLIAVRVGEKKGE